MLNKNTEAQNQDAFKWIHVPTYDSHTLLTIQKDYNIPSHIIESALDSKEFARMDYWDEQEEGIPNLIILRYPHKKIGNLGWIEYETIPLTILVYENTIITFAPTELDFDEHEEEFRFIELERTDRDFFILSLIWNMGAEYMLFLEEIEERMNVLESQLRKSTESNQLFGLMSLQKSLVFFESAVEGNHPVIKKLDKISSFNKTEKSRFLLKQLHIEMEKTEKSIDQTDILLKQISEVYASAVSNNLNVVMKFLSSITIILSVPSIIGTFWGMNVPVPLEKNPQGFVVLFLVSLFLTILSIVYFYRKDFL